MKPTRQDIRDAARHGNTDLLRTYAQQDGDFNEIELGDTLLEDIVADLCADQNPHRYDMVRLLLALGSDARMLGEENSSPLIPAMLCMDTEMLRILLDAGADPNRVSGFAEDELFYDWAEFDYRFEIYNANPPDTPTEEDEKDEDSWLRFLDRIAMKNSVRRPDHLFLLRQYGAMSAHEIGRNTEPGGAEHGASAGSSPSQDS